MAKAEPIKLTPIFDTLANLINNTHQNIILPSYINKLDYEQACQFLYCYRGSEATYNAYRRDIERFLHWNGLINKKSLQTVNRADIEAFIHFCQKPPTTWIGLQHVPRYIIENAQRVPNLKWRPFIVALPKIAAKKGLKADIKHYSLSQKALQAIFSVLSSFFSYLIQEDYIALNPVSQIRQKNKFLRKQTEKTVIRRLSELQWSYVIETAEIMATKDPQQHERTLFIMNALFGMYLRISELAANERWQPQMGDFQRDHDGNWWFTTVGKGNKQRQISVSDAMLKALKRYRTFLGLPPFPAPGETSALIRKNKNHDPITSTRHIRNIVQACFDRAIQRLENDGFLDEAEQLMAATVHWLRHTGISEDVKHRPREHVRDDAGHSSSAITDKYIDIELRERHASARKKVINPYEGLITSDSNQKS